MDINEKCEIIEELMRDHIDNNLLDGNEIDEFVSFNNLGIPLAQSISYNLATLTALGEEIVEGTWVSMCELLEVDPNKDYQDLDDLFLNG
jgi:hypothetical protein